MTNEWKIYFQWAWKDSIIFAEEQNGLSGFLAFECQNITVLEHETHNSTIMGPQFHSLS